MKTSIIFLLITFFLIVADSMRSDPFPSLLEGKLRTRKMSPNTSFKAALYRCSVLYCTGILISAKHILTVSECLMEFFNVIRPDFTKYGAKISKLLIDDSVKEYKFAEVKIHKDYNLRTEELTNNLGVITLKITEQRPAFPHASKQNDEAYFALDPHDLGVVVMDDSNNAIGLLSSIPYGTHGGNTAIYTFFKNHNNWIDIAIKEITELPSWQKYYKLITPQMHYFGEMS